MFTKKKIIIGIVALALIGGFFYYRSKNAVVIVQTETVKRGDVAETVSVTGELVPNEYADLSFQNAGVVDKILISKGDAVKARQLIASLDSSVLQSDLKEARTKFFIAEQDEKFAKLRRNSVGKSWDNLKPEERAKIKLTTQEARDAVNTAFAQLKENMIYSPLDGSVSMLDMRVGEVVTLGKVVVRVAQSGDLIIEARVPESDIIKITIGMSSKITFDAFRSDEIFDAAVIEIDPASTVVQDVVSYKVKFRMEKADSRLKEGMTANIDIETAKRENVLMVPSRVLVKEGSKTFAEVKQADGTFTKIEVVTGLEGDDGTIEIKSGLKEGNEISTLATQTK